MLTRISRGNSIHRRSSHRRRPRNRRDRRNPKTHLPPSRASSIDPEKSRRTLIAPGPAHHHVNPVS
jgi:hypothetical protein